jgi:hypothetical protein
MKKLTLILLAMACISLYGAEPQTMAKAMAKKPVTVKVDTCKTDTCIKVAMKSVVKNVNALVDKSTTDDSTKIAVKNLTSDLPNGVEKTKEVLDIIHKKDTYASKLEYILYLISSILALLTFLAGLVQKIRALPVWMSPLHIISKLFGKGKTKTVAGTVDVNNNIIPTDVKADVQSVVVPDGYEIKLVPTEKPV